MFSKSHSTSPQAGTPGIFYRERAKFSGSKQRVRVYCLAVKDADRRLRWIQTDERGADLLSLDAAKERKPQLSTQSGQVRRLSSRPK